MLRCTLKARGVCDILPYDEKTHGSIRAFKSRIVNEIKAKNGDKPYEKSRLVIQGYADDGKAVILTQSPTIQRASQRLILSLAPSLFKNGMSLWIRDITQAYTQSATPLNRTILAHLPVQIRDQYPPGSIMLVKRPLYGIAEAGTHWWATYNRHHKEKLQMVSSTYDPCLLISADGSDDFAIVGMQTDDTLGISTATFSEREDDELEKASLAAKPKQFLTSESPLAFNGGILTLEDDGLVMRQKGQGKKLAIVSGDTNLNKQYVEQRARGAYIASICQPEALYDLSIAAQHQNPSADEVAALNRRIKWQIENLDRGLAYVPLEITNAKLFVFVDGSFAKNVDMSSQLGYAVVLAEEYSISDNVLKIRGNLVHYSSTKSKRVTRSVLASEVYGMVAGVDMTYALASTLNIVTERLKLSPIPTIVCTDSYSLYECLVKLGTTKEKRLMIDIMALRQSYERRELHEIRWINGNDNLADAFTKKAPNRALERLIDDNTVEIRMEGWVTQK